VDFELIVRSWGYSKPYRTNVMTVIEKKETTIRKM